MQRMNTSLPISLTSGSIEPSSIGVMPSLPWGLLLDPYIAEVPLVERNGITRINRERRKDDATRQLLRISL